MLIGLPKRTPAVFKLHTAIPTTAHPAYFKNPCLKASPSLAIKTPNPKNTGLVPATNAAITAAPQTGFPEATVSAIIACVVPQGISTVAAPKTVGANHAPLFAWPLIHRGKNLGGCKIKYRKNGCTSKRAKPTPSMYTAAAA